MYFTGEFDYEAQSESVYSVEEDLSAQDLVDFSPVYRCLHIHTVLDAKETYENYYRKQRKKQARLALQPPTNMVRFVISLLGFSSLQILIFSYTYSTKRSKGTVNTSTASSASSLWKTTS
jgi:hypothetical protein